jgi:hypothetical protein
VDASSKGSLQAAAAYDIVGNKALKIKQVMGELQQLGPMKLIEKEQIDQIDAAFKKIDEAKRRLTVSAAPSIVGGMNFASTYFEEMEKSSSDKSILGIANHLGAAKTVGVIYNTIMRMIAESGGDPSGAALPLPSKASASDVNAAAMATAEAEEKAKEKRSSSFNRAGPSSLNQGGGFFFDRPARQDDPNSRRLERVAVATEKTARVMEETVR